MFIISEFIFDVLALFGESENIFWIFQNHRSVFLHSFGPILSAALGKLKSLAKCVSQKEEERSRRKMNRRKKKER